MKRIIIASNNAHKIEEIKAILQIPDCEIVSLREAGISIDPEEDGQSFEENALIKARALHELSHCAVIADDSGLCVEALDGAPSIHSARFAGEHGNDEANNEKLLALLENYPKQEDRKAYFACVIAFIDAKGNESCFEGRCEGFIGTEAIGDKGFGYDPLFYPLELGLSLSFAQVPQETKSKISHRGRALEQLRAYLKSTECKNL